MSKDEDFVVEATVADLRVTTCLKILTGQIRCSSQSIGRTNSLIHSKRLPTYEYCTRTPYSIHRGLTCPAHRVFFSPLANKLSSPFALANLPDRGVGAPHHKLFCVDQRSVAISRNLVAGGSRHSGEKSGSILSERLGDSPRERRLGHGRRG